MELIAFLLDKIEIIWFIICFWDFAPKECTLKNVQEQNSALFCSMRWSDNGGQIHWRNHQGLVQCDVGCQSRKWYANYKGEAIKNDSNLDSFCPNFLRCVKKISLRNHPTYRAPAVAPGLAPPGSRPASTGRSGRGRSARICRFHPTCRYGNACNYLHIWVKLTPLHLLRDLRRVAKWLSTYRLSPEHPFFPTASSKHVFWGDKTHHMDKNNHGIQNFWKVSWIQKKNQKQPLLIFTPGLL